MLSYQLCKELKGAGFPEHDSDYCNIGGCWSGAGVCRPLLSELISACGEEFKTLERFVVHKSKEGPRSWYANNDCYGRSPEEAVARLYLALNEKK